MRIYPLYDIITNFEFSLRYYNGKEYLALDENEFIENLKFNEFEKDNRCYSKVFLNDKLMELKQMLLYFRNILIAESKRFENKYSHFDLFIFLQNEFYKKGVSISIESFNRNALILHHLTQDIIEEIEHRLQLINSLISSQDYQFQDRSIPNIYTPNRTWGLKQKQRGEISYIEWSRLQLNKYTELLEETNYENFFTPKSLEKFKSFKEKIDMSWSKPKLSMLVRLLNNDGYFKYKLSKEEMIKFSELLTPKKFSERNFHDEAPSKERWVNDYGGFDF